MSNSNDETGNIYGLLTVLEKVGNTREGYVIWRCRCSCGREVNRIGRNLRKAQRAGRLTACPSCQGKYRLRSGQSSLNSLYKAYMMTGKERGYSWELSPEDFEELTGKPCFYCGVEPSQIHRSNKHSNGGYKYNGIDRLDNTIGYVKGNVVPCCGTCNKAKNTLSLQDFMSWIDAVHETMHARDS